MSPSLKQLAAEVRKVWSPPVGRPWPMADLAIMKLLRAIEEQDQPKHEWCTTCRQWIASGGGPWCSCSTPTPGAP